MHFYFTPYMVPIILTIATSVFVVLILWRRRSASGAIALIWMLLAVLVWSVANIFELGGAELSTKLLFVNIEYLGIVTVPVAWFVFTLQYTNQTKWITRRNLVLLAIIPLITLILIWTNNVHGLMRYDTYLDTGGLIPVVAKEYGMWFWVLAAYSYLLLASGTSLLIRRLFRFPRLFFKQGITMISCVLIVWLGNLLYIFHLIPNYPIDTTPIAFALAGLVISAGLFRSRLFNITSIESDIVIKNISDGVIVLDAKNRVVDINQAALSSIGYSGSEIVGQRIDYILADQLGLHNAHFHSATLGTQTELVIGEGKAPQQQQRYYDLRLLPVQNRSKGSNRVMILHDITERKKAEEQHRVILRTAHDGFWITDLQGRLLEVNDSYCEMVGYTQEELLTMSISDVEVTEGPEETAKHIKNIMKQGCDHFETRHKRKDGRIIDVEVSVNYLDVGEGQMFVFVRDITERKQAEEEAEASKSKLQHTLENMIDGVGVSNSQGEIIQVNRAFIKMHGYSSPSEVIGKNFFDTFVAKEALPIITTQYKKSIRKKQRIVRNLEGVNVRKDGSVFPIVSNITRLWDNEGNHTGNIAVVRDITERKLVEKELQRLYKHEKDLRQKLEEEINKRIEFTRVLVHELKTPITPVLSSSELLIEELSDGPSLLLAKNINRGASNLALKINELLDLAKGEIGMLQVNPKRVYPLKLLQEIASEVTPIALRRGQHLSLDLPASLPMIRGDEERLGQILLNLLNNAFKFTPTGGKITLRSREDGTNLIVEVEDTGHGIGKKEQQQLFKPYSQLTRDEGHFSGLGLGLSLSKRLVELHGGQIWVKSQRGKGSTFGFSVPIKGVRESSKRR